MRDVHKSVMYFSQFGPGQRICSQAVLKVISRPVLFVTLRFVMLSNFT